MTIQEIKNELASIDDRTKELLARLDDEGVTEEEVEEIVEESKELEGKKTELEKSLKEKEKALDEEKAKLRAKALNGVTVKTFKEENKMEKTYTLKSAEYKTAWAKSLMGKALSDFDKEVISKAVGDAITTTSDTFVQADATHNGINNGGLFVPTDVILGVFEKIAEVSPFFRDIRKLNVNGNVELPYLDEADGAQWLAETAPTPNEGFKAVKITLTGKELAKKIVLTWKVAEMTVDGFIDYLIEEINEKMGDAIATAALYGTGETQPIGATNGLTPVTDGESAMDTILNTYASLSQKAKKGAKAYVSTAVGLALIAYKTTDGNYPYLQGINGTALFSIEVDPYLQNNDIVVGNAKNYIWNTNTAIRIDRESKITDRKVVYGGYGIFDGAPKTGAFAYGQYTETISA